MATPTSTPFELTGRDGGAVRGAVRTADARRPAVVLCAGTEPLALRLARAGFTVVSFDGGDAALGLVLGAARDGALGLEPPALGLFGRAAGGSAAVRRTAHDPAVRALVTWATPDDALRAAAQVRVPWLIVHGAADDLVPADAAELLYRVAPAGTAEKLLLGDIGADEQALAATVGWFSRHLAP